MSAQPFNYYSKFSPIAKNGFPDYDRQSEAWETFISEQEYYFQNGYQAGGDKISGRMYFYLNYFHLQRLNQEGYKVNRKPSYVDAQREIFDTIEECLITGEDILVGKARDKGFSYIIASISLFETQLKEGVSVLGLFPGGKSEALTLFRDKYDIAHDNLIDDFKHYSDLKDTKYGYRYGFEMTDEQGNKKIFGNNSSLTMIHATDADVAKAGRPKWIFLEEFGELNEPLKLIQTNKANMREGGRKFGITLAGGTSNAFKGGYRDFRTLRNKHEDYGFRWIFIPAQKSYFPFVNEETGESDQAGALDDILKRRKGLTGELLMIEQQNYPTNEEEMFTVINKSPFNAQHIAKQIALVETNKEIQSQIQIGDLYYDGTGAVRFRLNAQGWWKIYRHPAKDLIYPDVIATDSYRLSDVNKSEVISKGAIMVRRPFQGLSREGGMTIAILRERPEDKDEFFAECVKAEKYWNAQNLIEHTDDDIFKYHVTNNAIKYVYRRPLSLDSPWSKATYKFGIKPTKEAISKAKEMAVKEFNNTWENEVFVEVLEDLSNFDEENVDLGMCYLWSIVHAEDKVSEKPKEAAREAFFVPYMAMTGTGKRINITSREMHNALSGARPQR